MIITKLLNNLSTEDSKFHINVLKIQTTRYHLLVPYTMWIYSNYGNLVNITTYNSHIEYTEKISISLSIRLFIKSKFVF